VEFAEFLDALAIHCGAQPNLIKDSRLPAAVVSATYTEYERFRKLLRAFDPNRSFRSELSDRLNL
jgi:FAD/FMN-containing dehydrogenase